MREKKNSCSERGAITSNFRKNLMPLRVAWKSKFSMRCHFDGKQINSVSPS